ncbi:MAG: hypothetical protein ABI083_16450 [Lapillicoccus sp.]
MEMHPTLARLDHLATSLARDHDVRAVLGLGSAGLEHDRFDEHSDIDFFVIIDTAAAKQRYLAAVDWLAPMGVVTFDFINDPNGRKALFDDGLFVEYAVLTPQELSAIPVVGARVVWERSGARLDVTSGPTIPPPTSLDTVDFHLNEALTNLFVGLHRELRGERLTASRFIQVFAVDRVLALTRLTQRSTSPRDPFDAARRVETGYPTLVEALRHMVGGYDQNRESAAAVLAWLTAHHDLNPVILSAITALITTLSDSDSNTDTDSDTPG